MLSLRNALLEGKTQNSEVLMLELWTSEKGNQAPTEGAGGREEERVGGVITEKRSKKTTHLILDQTRQTMKMRMIVLSGGARQLATAHAHKNY